MIKSKNRNLWVILLAAVFSCGVLFMISHTTSVNAEQYCTSGKNLVADGSFEQSSSLGEEYAWQAVTALDVGAMAPGIGVDNWEANVNSKQGTANVFMAGAGSYLQTGTPIKLYQDIAVEKNTEYMLSFWLKKWADGNNTPAFDYGIAAEDTFDYTMRQTVESGALGGTYKPFRLNFNSGNLSNVRILFSFLTADVNVAGEIGFHLDEVSLEKVNRTNLLSDASFETQETIDQNSSPWTMFPDAVLGWDRAGTASYEGVGSVWMEASNDNLAGKKNGIYQDVTVQAGKTYQLSAHIKKWAEGNKVGAIHLGYADPNASDPFAAVKEIIYQNPLGTFQEVKFDFYNAELTEIRVFLYTDCISKAEADGYGTGFHFDLISLFEKEDMEYITDGGFEASPRTLSADTSWRSFAATGVGVDTFPGNISAYEGTANAFICSVGSFAENTKLGIYQDVAVKPNTYYKFTFNIKKWDMNNIVAPVVYGYSDPSSETPDEAVDSRTYTFGQTQNYQKLTYIFNTGDLTKIRIFIYNNSLPKETNGGYDTGFHVDEISLKEASEYAVTVGEIVNGQISIFPEGNSFVEGTEITVTAAPAEGYELKEVCVNGKAIEGNTFVLAEDSVITAVFEKIQYAVTVGEIVNGQISISPEGNSLAAGTEITVTATPAEGYELKEICVNGKAIEGNTFILTQDSVITAVFEEMEVHPPVGDGQVEDPAGDDSDNSSGCNASIGPVGIGCFALLGTAVIFIKKRKGAK